MSSDASISGGAAPGSATCTAWLAVISGENSAGRSRPPTRIAGEILRASGSSTLSMNQGAGRFLNGRANSWPKTTESTANGALKRPCSATQVRRLRPLKSAGGVEGRWRM